MRAYLDHNATSPLRKEARRALERALDASAGNASSLHAEGRAARALLEAAREQVAALAGCPPREVVLTSGGSEAIAAAIRGVADRAPAPRRRIVVSSVEHSAVLEAARALARHGFGITEVPCAPSGRIEPERFAEALGPDVALATLQAANNETGVLQPVTEVSSACRTAGAPFLVDAVQAAGKIPLERADLLAISGHKLGGPQGTGALIVRDGLPMAPIVHGGAQERRRRGGTEAGAPRAGLGAACEAAARDLGDEAKRLHALQEKLEAGLRALAPGLRVHGDGVPRLPNTTNVAFPGIAGETLVIALDLAGIAASTGSACASGAVLPSHVLRAMGLADDEARTAVRFSLGWSSTAADVDALLAALPAVLAHHGGRKLVDR
jgi:cysteine desulfurase